MEKLETHHRNCAHTRCICRCFAADVRANVGRFGYGLGLLESSDVCVYRAGIDLQLHAQAGKTTQPEVAA